MKAKSKKTLITLLIIIATIATLAIIYSTQKNEKAIRNETLLTQVLSEGEPIIIGSNRAEKSLIVFYDYNCSNCTKFFKTTYPKIEKELINTEQLNIILKPVNLTHNKACQQAYQLLSCLNHIGSFNDLHEILLIDPSFVHDNEFAIFMDNIIQENEEIAQCMSRNEADYQTSKNTTQLHKLGYNAVPLFILGNRAYKGTIDTQTIHNSFKR